MGGGVGGVTMRDEKTRPGGVIPACGIAEKTSIPPAGRKAGGEHWAGGQQ